MIRRTMVKGRLSPNFSHGPVVGIASRADVAADG